jgi:hypothetical protein
VIMLLIADACSGISTLNSDTNAFQGRRKKQHMIVNSCSESVQRRRPSSIGLPETTKSQIINYLQVRFKKKRPIGNLSNREIRLGVATR